MQMFDMLLKIPQQSSLKKEISFTVNMKVCCHDAVHKDCRALVTPFFWIPQMHNLKSLCFFHTTFDVKEYIHAILVIQTNMGDSGYKSLVFLKIKRIHILSPHVNK